MSFLKRAKERRTSSEVDRLMKSYQKFIEEAPKEILDIPADMSDELETPFEKFIFKMLLKAFYEASKGKHHTEDQHRFEINAPENILRLTLDILNGKYHPSRGIAFITRKPVIREIFAAPFRDRVVHHFIYDMVNDWWEKHLIPDSYSCRKNKGTLKGIKRAHTQMRRCSKNYTIPCHVIKLDIKAFFMSLDRKKLLERILWGLDEQFKDNKGPLYEVIKYLWTEVIMDDPVKGVKRRGKESDWDDLPWDKSLFHRPEGIGIVIGNLTSQLASNIFLDQLDRFIRFELGYKYYGRYVDDFYLVVTDDEYPQALEDIEKIRVFLEALGLTLHKDKHYIQPIEKGMPFLGAMIYPKKIVPNHRITKAFNTTAELFESGHAELEQVVSYLGMMKNYDGEKVVRKVFDRLGWEY